MEKVSRKDLLRSVKRVVGKVGSGVLTAENGLNMAVIDDLTADICSIKEKKIDVISFHPAL